MCGNELEICHFIAMFRIAMKPIQLQSQD